MPEVGPEKDDAKSTNNEAEYEALLAGLRIARKMKIQNLEAKVDSKLLASVAFNHLTKEIRVEVLNERSTDTKEINIVVEEEENNWVTPIIQCLEKGIWPKDKNENAFRATIDGSKGDEAETHASVPKLPKTLMTSIMAPSPFCQWGMEIFKPLPHATGRVKFVIGAID
ncbi:reverse transcriptase domain-containing protein [Tanacetum coccineum]